MAIARERLIIAVAVAAAHLAAILLLLDARNILILPTNRPSVAIFDVAPPPPPPPEIAAEASGRPAPPAPRAGPRPVEARPVRRPANPAPPIAATGPDTTAGAAEAGPGSGAGGQGTGLGAGGSGGGTGGGAVTRARRLSGRILDADYPRAARRDRAEGRVVAVFTVGPDGRASDCRPYRSSGNAALDDTTCRLIEDRFTFEPARDARGRPVSEDEVGWQQDWWFEGR